MAGEFYLLKIELKNIEPVIWRRFVVPASISLDRLHDVIQIVMGWKDSHLHEFSIGKKRFTEFPESKQDGSGCGRYRLCDLIKRKGRTFQYLYDFGDSWEHEITLERNEYIMLESHAPVVCLDGARACPPEDVGGEPGYFEFCAAIADPTDEDHNLLLEWVGGKYDSESFDLHAVNWELINFLRWSRDRYLSWGVM